MVEEQETAKCNYGVLAKAQIQIAELITKGFKVHWSGINPAAYGWWSETLISNIGFAYSCSKDPMDYPNLGWDRHSFKSWCRTSINARMKNYIDDYYAGSSLKEVDLPFESGSFWVQQMSRNECSCVSQFLSNHFPCQWYLHRFNLGVDSPQCYCGSFCDDRNHLLFECPLLNAAREQLKTVLDVNSLSWSMIRSKKSALIPFVLSIKECWKNHGKRW